MQVFDKHPHTLSVRVYYEDTDFSGNVYYASYLRFCERGRTEWLRILGVHHAVLAEQGYAFAVRHMDIDFIKGAGIDDELDILTELVELSGARLSVEQTIARGGEVILKARVKIAAITLDGKATRLPQNLREALAAR